MIRKTACVLALALAVLTGSAAAQANAWQHKWYWGAQGGIMRFETVDAFGVQTGWQDAFTVGGHWLITGSRSALYVAFDQVLFKDSTNSSVVDQSSPSGIRSVLFDKGRRIQAMLLIFPTDGYIQPYLGGGFGIHQVVDASPEGTFNTPQELENTLRTIDETSTRAFPILAGGLQMRFGRLALFGQAQYMPMGRNYLITSAQYVGSVGFRYAVSASREDVTAKR
jgi:hypothetical protein